ncbi:MAG TPA: peptidoglycan DD-metalloendopeptidase family protein [Vicinamibacterales bacterium]
MIHRVKVYSIVGALIACCGLSAQEADRPDTEVLSRRAAERLKTLHDEAEQLAAQEKTVLGQLRKLEVQRQIKSEELRQAEDDAARVARELSALDQQIFMLDRQARNDIPILRNRILNLYKLGDGGYVRLLLSTTDVRRFGQASRLVVELASQDRRRVLDHQRRLDELHASRETVTDRQARLVALKTQVQRARAEIDRVLETRNALIREIDDRRDLNAQLSSELLAAQQKLQSEMTDLSSGSTPSLPIGPFRGDLDWPLAGPLRQRYGLSESGRAVNNGIDIAAEEGLPVRAIHAGTVAYADAFTGFGRLVIVDHGSQNFSLYGNLKEIAVEKGAHVQNGATLGSVGSTPTGATGLYFELRIDGHAVDPLQWLKKR